MSFRGNFIINLFGASGKLLRSFSIFTSAKYRSQNLTGDKVTTPFRYTSRFLVSYSRFAFNNLGDRYRHFNQTTLYESLMLMWKQICYSWRCSEEYFSIIIIAIIKIINGPLLAINMKFMNEGGRWRLLSSVIAWHNRPLSTKWKLPLVIDTPTSIAS